MGNIIRLSSGGRLQVRTGVLQGVGPEGPTGPAGPQGPDGPQGPVGVDGPTGQILQIQTQVKVSNFSIPIPINADTLVPFNLVTHDDLGMATSTTLFTAAQPGDYTFDCWLGHDQARAFDLWVYDVTDAVPVVRGSFTGAYGALSYAYRVSAGKTFRVYTRSTVAANVTSGALSLTRTGSGPYGPQGPAGPVGPQGSNGPTGPQGPAGTANSGYATYSNLKST